MIKWLNESRAIVSAADDVEAFDIYEKACHEGADLDRIEIIQIDEGVFEIGPEEDD